MPKKLTTKEFIEKAKLVHGNKYDYSLVEYYNTSTKVKIICKKHGVFEQTPEKHIQNRGCPVCGGKNKLSTEEFIEKAKSVHGNKYDYSLVKYINSKTKVKILCKNHGVFEQNSNNHLSKKCGCPKCSNSIKKFKNNKPLYEFFHKDIDWIEECKKSKEGGYLEVRCKKCNKWLVPDKQSFQNRIQVLKGNYYGEQNLYCSDECKNSCSVFGQIKYPVGMNPN